MEHLPFFRPDRKSLMEASFKSQHHILGTFCKKLEATTSTLRCTVTRIHILCDGRSSASLSTTVLAAQVAALSTKTSLPAEASICRCTMPKYTPRAAMSSSCVPRSTMRPSSMSRIRSAR